MNTIAPQTAPQVAAPAKRATTVSVVTVARNELTAMKPQFVRVLPQEIGIEKFMRVAETVMQNTPALLDDKKSFYSACMKAAQDGLMPDGREAVILPMSGKATYWPMVQGLVKLARNSGEIANIIAEVVYSNDKFTYRLGIDETPIHEPDWFSDDRGDPKGAWAVIALKNGEKVVAVMPKARILKIGSGHNKAQYDTKTGKYFEEWWKKTVIKNALKYAPRSTELDRIRKMEAELEGTDEAEISTASVSQQEDVISSLAGEAVVAPQEPKAPRKASSRLSAIKQANGVANGSVTEAIVTAPATPTRPPVQPDLTESEAEYEEVPEEEEDRI